MDARRSAPSGHARQRTGISVTACGTLPSEAVWPGTVATTIDPTIGIPAASHGQRAEARKLTGRSSASAAAERALHVRGN
eukprot:scaffold198399_cov30-Tisochrysis_lutea.AAC.4